MRAQLGFGSAPIATASIDDAVAAVQRAHALGIRTFDTAPRYGLGEAERRLGIALQGVDRSSYRVSTKVGWLIPVDAPTIADANTGPVPAFSKDAVKRSLEGSLRRLGLDRVDIALIHDPEQHLPAAIDNVAPALLELREQRLVSAIGVGTTRVDAALQLVTSCELDYCLIGGRYSLLDQEASTHLLPACASRGVLTIVGGVFNSGITATRELSGLFDYREASRGVRERAERIAEVVENHDVPLAAVALQYPARNSAVDCILAGMKNANEVSTNVALFQANLPDGLWRDLAQSGLINEPTNLTLDDGRRSPC